MKILVLAPKLDVYCLPSVCQIHILRLGHHTKRHHRSLGKPHQEDGREERYERGKEQAEERRVVVVRGTKTSAEVTGLRLFSNYELTVTAFNSKGEGPHSDPHHFSTPEGGEMVSVVTSAFTRVERLGVFICSTIMLIGLCVCVCLCAAPGPPASLTLQSPSETSLILYWTPPTEANGILLGYVVQYQQGNDSHHGDTDHLAMLLFFWDIQ